MKKRDDIYSKEAAEILRSVTMYKTLKSAQIFKLYPGRGSKVQIILSHLINQGRMAYDARSDFLTAAGGNEPPDAQMVAAFWVLLDFIDRIEYHTAGDFPVKLSFFAEGDMYDIIYVSLGQEALIMSALRSINDAPRRIIIVDDMAQISRINVPNTTGYCIIAADGVITYYKRGADESVSDG